MYILINKHQVPVTGESCVDLARAVVATPFKEWIARMDSRLTVHAIHFQSVDYFGSRVGFLKFKADVTTPDGVKIPGVVFMRGGVVVMLAILHCEGKSYSLMVKQPRVPIGAFDALETPAGMIDDEGHFAGVAAREIEEETGLVIRAEDLTDLTAWAFGAGVPGIYISPGGSDEFARIFFFEKDVTPEELEKMRGAKHGEEHESITLDIVPLKDVWRVAHSASTFTALFLYEKYRQLHERG